MPVTLYGHYAQYGQNELIFMQCVDKKDIMDTVDNKTPFESGCCGFKSRRGRREMGDKFINNHKNKRESTPI